MATQKSPTNVTPIKSTPTDVNTLTKKAVAKQPGNERQQKMANTTKLEQDTTSKVQENTDVTTQPKKDEKAPPPFALIHVKPTLQNKYIVVTLPELISLDDTPIPDIQVALRQVNKEHVEHLRMAYESGAHIPAIKVTGTTWGLAIVGGYHRVAAMELAVASRFVGEDGKVAKERQEEYEKARKSYKFQAEVLNSAEGGPLSVEQVINLAYTDNLTSGLPIADKNRSRYAIWLIARAKERGEVLSLEKAGKIAGVSRIAVFRQLQRDNGIKPKGRAPADMVSTAEDKNDVVEYISEQEATKTDPFKVTAIRLLNSIMNIYDSVQDVDTLANYLNDLAKTIKRDNDTINAAISTVTSALTFVDVPAASGVVTKLQPQTQPAKKEVATK